MKKNNIIRPLMFRFFALFSHAMATASSYQFIPTLVNAGLGPNASDEAFSRNADSLVAFLHFSIALMCADALFMFMGVSLHSPLLTLLHGCLHSLGFLFTTWAIFEGWNWLTLPYTCALFTFPPLLVEIISLKSWRLARHGL